MSKNANWKEKWILLENEHKQPTIDLRWNYIYLFNGQKKSRPSYELNTCLLYSYIKHKKTNLGEDALEQPVLVPNQDKLDKNKLPRRYFTFKGWKIAFCPTQNDNDKHWWIWKDNDVKRYSTDKIYDAVQNLE